MNKKVNCILILELKLAIFDIIFKLIELLIVFSI